MSPPTAWFSVDTRISSMARFTSMLQTAKLAREFEGLILVAGFQCLSHQDEHSSPTHTNLQRCVYQAFCFCHSVHSISCLSANLDRVSFVLHLFPQTCFIPKTSVFRASTGPLLALLFTVTSCLTAGGKYAYGDACND